MPYAITINGWRAITEGMALQDGETYVEDIPQALLEVVAAASVRAEKVQAEDAWRDQEVVAINNQLMAIEEAEATGEDTGVLPGTRLQWLQYRTKVRNWKEGSESFPDCDHRPNRPE
ncbi:hypothetical protein [Pseudomonas sp. TH15]|uniref:hypothetical protein n=1 Tax=Pseudomonas sp. TH15 TaxID=2796381 RepID=UPI0019128286|nr:hypothetical protein [Pseudomonas sp. TH15]MBK5512273.1 hypothetical protein [Pseudomonas sp. TH15]